MFNLRLNWVKREHNSTINMFTDELELLNVKDELDLLNVKDEL